MMDDLEKIKEKEMEIEKRLFHGTEESRSFGSDENKKRKNGKTEIVES